MTVSRTRAGNTESFVYMLDGTPSKNMSGPPGQPTDITYTSKWEGTVLITTIVMPAVNPHREALDSRLC